jgi:subtilisin family serine protease
VIRTLLAALIVCGLGACSHTPRHAETPATSRALMESAGNYIVAAVDNEPTAAMGRAGSTPRGYDGLAAYGPSPRAQRLMQSLEHDYGLREVSAWPIMPLHMHCAVLEVPSGADRTALLATLSADPRIRLVQPLQTFITRTESYNDPYVGLQQGFQQMDVPDAHTWSQGSGVSIAIIDTGVDSGHPDLRGAIVREANFVDADRQQFRRDRHGTEVAGIIAAVANNGLGIVGVAPAAHLMVFKACWQLLPDADPARCNSFTLAQALVAALDARAQVVNLSLAGPGDPLLEKLIAEGMRRGIVFVGAAPSDATNSNDRLMQQSGIIQVASMNSQTSSEAPVYAPGREILTLLPGGHYDFASGSSLAAAHVTGTVALLLSMKPQLSATTLLQLLRDATTPVANAAGDIRGVDACSAVVALAGYGACRDHKMVERKGIEPSTFALRTRRSPN